jgi:hypothetical protein
MAEHLRVYAAYLWELCTAVVLPFEFVSVAEQFEARLAALARAEDAVGLAGALERARAFREAASRLDAAAERLRGLHAADPAAETAEAERVNDCLKRLSRALVPLASTAAGAYAHDPYGYTPQGSMIPTLFDMPRLAGLAAGPERWMLETQLVRARNRVADTLEDCTNAIAATLRDIG